MSAVPQGAADIFVVRFLFLLEVGVSCNNLVAKSVSMA